MNILQQFGLLIGSPYLQILLDLISCFLNSRISPAVEAYDFMQVCRPVFLAPQEKKRLWFERQFSSACELSDILESSFCFAAACVSVQTDELQ